MTVMKSGLESNRRAPFRPWGNIACPMRQLSPSPWRCRMAMLRGPSTAALGIPADPSVEGVGVVAIAQPGGAGPTSTTGSRLPITTPSTNSHKEGGSGRLSQRVALIDPKPLTRQSIRDLLTEADYEYVISAA